MDFCRREVLMNRPIVAMFLSLACAVPAMGQADESATTLRVNSRAVLVDVIVTDSSGKPVTGLSRDAFSVKEQGKPQTISFFEENGNTPPPRPVEMPTMPPDVFTNFSPFPQPPAVNVLLLDSLNTHMENQSYVHKQALQFLKSAKPGTRMAIFTMGLGLHFIQGFNDDPAVLMAALNNKKNNEIETSVMLKGQDETNAQQNVIGMMSTPEGNGATAAPAEMIAALQNFISENDTSRGFDRMYVTLANMQRLAAFLQGFPGRKNIIWFAEKVPALYVTGSDASGGVASGTPAVVDELKKTLAMLAAARAAIYPVDARGTSNYSLYTAESNLSHANSQASQIMGSSGTFSNAVRSEGEDRNSDQANAQILAEQSGGKAFANTNGLSDVINKITSTSSHFYTLSYSPTNAKMDGTLRNIEVTVEGGKYKLAYRRGYFAVEEALPGSSLSVRSQEVQKLAAKNPGAIDPLLPFMDLGMPQSEQILYKTLIVPAAAGQNEPADNKNKDHYKVDFAINLKDLHLNLDKDGLHKGELNISLIVYDRYGNIISREDHLVQLNIQPDVYAMFQNTGVQLHADLAVPKGNYWLRTGIFDRRSRKVGTMEIPLAAVKPLETAAK
jgi:VWFA-related protein